MNRLGVRQRLLYAGVGFGLLALLTIARCLHPNELGIGTHQELGLPPCTTVALFGIPCPTCGMTTSWAHFTRGHFNAAWRCQPGGFCLAMTAVAVSLWTLSMAASSRYLSWISIRASSIVAILITTITMVHWLWRIL